jgi:hypothetical protein
MKNYKGYFRILSVVCVLTFPVFFSSAPATAATLNIGSMNITGGTYTVWDSSGALITNPNSGSSTSPFTSFGPDTNLVGGYIGNGGGGLLNSTPDPASIAGGLWFDFPINMYTSTSNLGDDFSPAGSIAGGPVPTGILDDINDTIEMDLSSLFGNWSNVDINVGTGKGDGTTSALATGTWNPVTGAYSMTWTSTVANTVGGPCLPTNCVAQFTFEGTASPVPVPAAFWLLSSGLVGLLGFARKRKTNK